MSVLPGALAVINGKGGVGKTSITANVAGLAALAGHATLVVDMDPQGNLARDLGYSAKSDDGRSLLAAMQHGTAPQLVHDVRPGLDVVAGGDALHDWAGIAFGRASRDGNLLSALQLSLEALAGDYDLILFDCPPGELALQQQAAVASRFLVIPTTPDEGGLDGMVKVARLAERVEPMNPQLELLGVVAFRIATNARAIRAEVQADVVAAFGDSAVVFDTIVRDGLKTARDCRASGQLVHEYEQAALDQAPFWQALREGRQSKRLSQSATGLAADYQDLTREILERRAAALLAEMESVR